MFAFIVCIVNFMCHCTRGDVTPEKVTFTSVLLKCEETTMPFDIYGPHCSFTAQKAGESGRNHCYDYVFYT